MIHSKTTIEVLPEELVSLNFLKLSVLAALAVFVFVMTFALISSNAMGATEVCGSCDSSDIYDCDFECGECEEGYMEFYRCVGTRREQLYLNEDCTSEWKQIESCAQGCDNGRCVGSTWGVNMGEVIPKKPKGDLEEGDTISTTIIFRNQDDESQEFFFDAYVCEYDCVGSCSATNCRRMSCTDDDVDVGADDAEYMKCTKKAWDDGYYRIKVDYEVETSCGIVERTVFSEKFYVGKGDGDCDTCDDDDDDDDDDDIEEGELRCFGDFLQKSYENDNEDIRWEIVEECPYGCSNDACLSKSSSSSSTTGSATLMDPTNKGEPQVFMDRNVYAVSCDTTEFEFTLQNNGETDVFLLSVEGNAADWVTIPDEVKVESDGLMKLTGFIKVPCSITSGDYMLTITAEGKTSDSLSSIVRVKRGSGWLVLDPWSLLLLLLVVVAILLIFVFFRDGGYERIERIVYKEPESKDEGREGDNEPEEFKNAPLVIPPEKRPRNVEVYKKVSSYKV